jgi:hypothetical protein
VLGVYRYAVPITAALFLFGFAVCFRLNVFDFSNAVFPRSSVRQFALRAVGIGWVQVYGPKPYEDVEVPDGIDKAAWDSPLWEQRHIEARHKAEILNINHELDAFEIEHSLLQPTVTRKEARHYEALRAQREKLLKRITWSDDQFPAWPEVELGVTLAWARILNHFLFTRSMRVLLVLVGLLYGAARFQDHRRREDEERRAKEADEQQRRQAIEVARRDEEDRRAREQRAYEAEEARLRGEQERRERIDSERRAEWQRREAEARSGMGAAIDLHDAAPEERMAKIQSAKAKRGKKGRADEDDE